MAILITDVNMNNHQGTNTTNSNNDASNSNANNDQSSQSNNSNENVGDNNNNNDAVSKNGKVPKKRRRPTSMQQFPGKLHDMMAYVEQWGLDYIVSWVNDGRAVFVRDSKQLVSKVLPLFFGQSKFRSFTRQMNMWHFERILEGPYRGAFVHPFFMRGEKALCSHMSRHEPVDLSKLAIVKQLTMQQKQQRQQPSQVVQQRPQQPISNSQFQGFQPAVFTNGNGNNGNGNTASVMKNTCKPKLAMQPNQNYFQAIVNAIQSQASTDFDVEPIDVFHGRVKRSSFSAGSVVSQGSSSTATSSNSYDDSTNNNINTNSGSSNNNNSNDASRYHNLLDMAMETAMPPLTSYPVKTINMPTTAHIGASSMPIKAAPAIPSLSTTNIASNPLSSFELELTDDFFSMDDDEPQQKSLQMQQQQQPSYNLIPHGGNKMLDDNDDGDFASMFGGKMFFMTHDNSDNDCRSSLSINNNQPNMVSLNSLRGLENFNM